MSWQASAWAKTQKTGSPSRKAVLLCLAEATDQWGYAWVGGALIADEAELSLRQVRTLVGDLAKGGHITVFQGRRKDGVQHNLYRLNFKPKPKDKIPEDHPSLSGRYKHVRGPEDLTEPGENIAPGLSAEIAPGLGAGSDTARCNGASSLVKPTSPEPYITDKNGKTRAREADDPDGSASRAAPDDLAESEPVNAHWNARQDDIAKAFDPAQQRWLRDCIPHSDDGETLTLAVPSRFVGEQIDARLGRHRLERVLDRAVKFLRTDYARARRQARRDGQ